MAEREDLLGEPHLLRGHDPARDDAEHAAHTLAVHEEVAAEARQVGDLVSEVGVVAVLELLAVALGGDGPEHPLRVGGGEHRAVRQRLDLPVVPDDRWRADGHVEVRGLHPDQGPEQLVHLRGVTVSGRGPRSGGARRGGGAAGEPDDRLALRALQPERLVRSAGVVYGDRRLTLGAVGLHAVYTSGISMTRVIRSFWMRWFRLSSCKVRNICGRLRQSSTRLRCGHRVCTPLRWCRGRRTSPPCGACLRTWSGRRCQRAGRSRSARTRDVRGALRTLLPAAPRLFSRSRGRCFCGLRR